MTIPNPLTPTTIKTWAQQLPYANKPLLVRETFEVLRGIGQRQLPPKQRLKAIESLEYAIDLVLEHIKTRLAGGHGPTRRVLEAGEAYCEQLVNLCEDLAADAAGGTGLLKTGHTARRASVLTARYIEQWQLLRAIDHRPAPQGLWQRARELHQRQQGRDGGALARMVALHLASPRRLSGREILDLTALLSSLPAERLVTIASPSSKGGDIGFFLPTGDCPPEFGPMPWGASAVSLQGLSSQLRRSPPVAQDHRLMRTLLERWDGKQPPKTDRTVTARPIKTTAVIGLAGIIRHLSDLNPTFSMLVDDGFANSFTADNGLFAEHRDTTEVSFVDFSDGGCRLRTSWCAVQTGDVVAIFWGRVEWRLGSIVWMAKNGDDLECGVQWLLNHPEPVSLRFDTGETVRGISGNCLLDDRTGVLYCARSGHGGGPALINDGGDWRPIDLSVSKRTGLVDLARALPAREPVAPPTESSATTSPTSKPELDELWPSLQVFSAGASIS